jgi:predicted RNA methylase
MFNSEFYPTSIEVIEQMLEGYNISGKVILEPSAGSGNIVSYALNMAAKEVIACEKHDDLRKIVQTKCKVIADDFFTVTSDKISHIDMIIMNPPFSNADKHINHAFEVAPPGCTIIALCNYATFENTYSSFREHLKTTIEAYGSIQNIGNAFSTADRTTDVNVGLIRLHKPGANNNAEFDGFFLEDDPEETQFNGIMPYNIVRDLVNRYVAAVKLFDEQLETAQSCNAMIFWLFLFIKIAMHINEDGKVIIKQRAEFKKDLQKSAWNWIFEKMNMQKYSTKGLKADINKFVEQQTNVPFTMRNIYKMLEIVVGTQSQRMDKAIIGGV